MFAENFTQSLWAKSVADDDAIFSKSEIWHFTGKSPKETIIYMTCQALFTGKNKKNV